MNKRILVIEDNTKHLEDAKTFFSDKPEYHVDYETTGHEALCLIKEHRRANRIAEREGKPPVAFKYNGIITDLFLPWMKPHFTQEVPCGFGIAMLCEFAEIPYIVNTAGGRHGQKSRWVTEVFGALGETDQDFFRLVGAGSEDDDAKTKDWSKVLEFLLEKMDKPKS